MTILLPLLILLAILQIAAYWYVDKKRFSKGREKALFATLSMYILTVLALPFTPDGEYMSSGVELYMKTGIILVGTVFSFLIHLVMKQFKA